jgi:hypothetical protein
VFFVEMKPAVSGLEEVPEETEPIDKTSEKVFRRLGRFAI